ncbi:Rpn family recombination-promoting nuclease/putative transposase [uncultured Bacteroides sp.]|uniref:Rpn family recombination-promoting nuclease/putative transposase n=1 Tax=uncultured Bacteroides sp. TaxID=162156 RepID=UPI00260D869B|nr:Rpn family recombination-promoting nuclease/putative transposase [uncultured Bacteroides sp.]
MRYLDPKADLTFKKVFGEHPALVISLLNALLPFETEDEKIESVEYLPIELVPDTPLKKNSIVDVRCRDKQGRVFIVEMQMIWSPAFMHRVLFNASKAYVRQIDKSEKFELLQPVYSLNLVDDIFLPDVEEYYHDYRIVHMEHSDKVIEGLRFVFVELPKFKPHSFSEKKMQVLWLRYLTEVDEKTRVVPQELMDVPEIKMAVEQLEESAFNDAQLWGYDDFWDAVRVEKTLVSDVQNKYKEGIEQGIKQGIKQGVEQGIKQGVEQGIKQGVEQGIKQGVEQGIKQGIEQGKIDTALRMLQKGYTVNDVCDITGLERNVVSGLLNNK